MSNWCLSRPMSLRGGAQAGAAQAMASRTAVLDTVPLSLQRNNLNGFLEQGQLNARHFINAYKGALQQDGKMPLANLIAKQLMLLTRGNWHNVRPEFP